MSKNEKNEKYLHILFGFTLFIILLFLSLNKIEGDFYHIFNSGKWIVEHKVLPYENYEFVLPGYKTVIQQWLYSVMLYGSAQFGYAGVALFTLIQAAILLSMFYKLARTLGCNKTSGFIAASLSLWVFLEYINCRPQMITVILLLAGIMTIERYRISGNSKLLYLLPLFTLIEANVHVTCALFHLVIILPYAVPFVIKKYNIDIRRTDLIIPSLLSVGTMFINPYGVKGVLCVFFTADELASSVTELRSPELMSVYGTYMALSIILLFFLYRKNKLNSVVIWFVLGFGFLQVVSARNSIFLSIAVCYEAALLFDVSGIKILDFFDKIRFSLDKLMFIVMYTMYAMAGCFVVFLHVDSFVHNNDLEYNITDIYLEGLGDCIDHLKENSDTENIKVFTEFNMGARFVYNDIDHIYMQTKSEPYCEYVNEKENLMTEYIDIVTSHSDEYVDAFLDKYDFDYLCVTKRSSFLYCYLVRSAEYKQVVGPDEGSLYDCYLFERVGCAYDS